MSNQSSRGRRRVAAQAVPLAAAVALAALPGAVMLAAPARTLAAQPAAQATGRVVGTVTSSGQPVNGAQVVVVGTRLGAVTGTDGRFTIGGVPSGAQTVRVQRIGFAPRTVEVTVAAGQAATANFAIEATAVQLSQVAVVGYTNEARRDISGAVTSVTAAAISDQKVATVEEALRGRAPGVQIAASGEPGRPAQIVVRGQTGLGNPAPLYVVDGMYLAQSPNLNPNEIESIEILKDASAAAQYGAQSSNGVVVIRTKRGTSGDTRVGFSTYYGYQQVPKRIPMMSTSQWQALNQVAYTAGGQTPPAGVTQPSSISTNWQDALFRTGGIQDHNLSVSGGTPSANYYVSGGYTDQKGTLISTNFDRYSLRVNTDARRGRVTFGENLALAQVNRRGLVGYPLIEAVRMLPTIPVYDPSNLTPGATVGYGYGNDANPTFGNNPVGLLTANNNRIRANQAIGTAFGEVGIVGGLKYRLNLGFNYVDTSASNFASIAQLRFRSPNPTATLNEARLNATNVLVENLLNYDGSFGGGAHRVNAVAGYTQQRNNFDVVTAFRQGFTNEQVQTVNAGTTTALNNAGFRIPYRLNSFLGRANYVFRDRYLLTGNVRNDCSSRFSPSNRCGTFASGSVGWVVSEEGFFKNLPGAGALNFLKLRGSTGVLGDQNIGELAYIAPVNQNINYLFGGNVTQGATQLGLVNPDLRWQQNRSSDLGLDFAVLDNTLNFTGDYYVRKSEGVLVSVPLAPSLGAQGTPVLNAGSINNAGVELGVTHRFKRGDFQLQTNANYTYQKNRVLSLGNNSQPIFAGPFLVARTAVGGPVGEFYLRKMVGIFQTAEEVAGYKNSKGVVIQPGAQPGDVKFADLNDDGVISDDDRFAAGSGVPKYFGFFGLDGKYKAFDVGLNLRYSGGNKIFNVVRFWTERMDDINNSRADLQPWTPENHSTTTPRAVFGSAGALNATPNSTRFLDDGAFTRLQNVVVGYTLPPALARRLGALSSAPRVYVNGQNLYTWTKFTNWDPDVLGFNDPLARGVDDGFIFPQPRTVTFGVDLRF